MKSGVFNLIGSAIEKWYKEEKRVWTLKNEIRKIKEFFLGGRGKQNKTRGSSVKVNKTTTLIA